MRQNPTTIKSYYAGKIKRGSREIAIGMLCAAASLAYFGAWIGVIILIDVGQWVNAMLLAGALTLFTRRIYRK